MCIFPQQPLCQIEHKDELINLAERKNASIMSNITVDAGKEQLLLLLSSSTAIYTILSQNWSSKCSNCQGSLFTSLLHST